MPLTAANITRIPFVVLASLTIKAAQLLLLHTMMLHLDKKISE